MTAAAGSEPPGADPGRTRLCFTVSGERHSLPVAGVAEITRPRALTRVPHAPAALLGLVNLRGTVLPVFSLAMLLGRRNGALTPASRIIVTIKRPVVGLLVDGVTSMSTAADAPLDVERLLFEQFGRLAQAASVSRDRIAAEGAADAKQQERESLALIGLRVGGQDYALPLANAIAVQRLPATIAEVPGMDSAMVGVTTFRDRMLPLVSLRALLGLPKAAIAEAESRVIVTAVGGTLVGLVADTVDAILRALEEDIDPVPPILRRGLGETRVEAIYRWNGGTRLFGILSPARLFSDEAAARILVETQQGGAMKDAPERQDSRQFVVFRLADEDYALPIAAVDEVIRFPKTLTRVPKTPSFVEGVVNLRGRIVPVIDQSRRFALKPWDGERRVIVVKVDGVSAGFAVDAVSSILTVAGHELVEAPDLTATEAPLFDRVANLERDGRVILVVDPKAMLDRVERDLLTKMVAQDQEACAQASEEATKA